MILKDLFTLIFAGAASSVPAVGDLAHDTGGMTRRDSNRWTANQSRRARPLTAS